MGLARKPLNYENRYRLILIWILINANIGLIFAFFISLGVKDSFGDILKICLLSTYTISFFSCITGYATGYFCHNYSLFTIILLNIIATLTATYIGIKVSLIVADSLKSFINFPMVHSITNKLIIPILLISSMVSVFAVCIEYLKYNQEKLNNNLKELKKKITGIQPLDGDKAHLTVNTNGMVRKVNYNSIIYLSSSGKKTLLHTKQKDHELAQLFKKTENALPQDLFIRIHKQYIVNANYISHIKYYKGGRYMLYLNDEDDTILPVGGLFTNVLKDKIEAHS